jgi:hypothetical protein
MFFRSFKNIGFKQFHLVAHLETWPSAIEETVGCTAVLGANPASSHIFVFCSHCYNPDLQNEKCRL